MRYVVGFLCVCAFGVMPVLGCSEATPECQIDDDCDDQNECTDDHCNTANGSCYFQPPRRGTRFCDDGDDNECMFGECVDGVCTPVSYCPYVACGYDPYWVDNETPCESDGIPGVCLCGLCRADPRECSTDEECDDGNECTEDFCSYCAGSCEADSWYGECDSCDRNGVPGLCIDGFCEEEPECSTDGECDDGIACTDDVCDYCYGCEHFVNCYDGDPCTEDRCDPDTGCSYPTSPDGTDCGCLAWSWDCGCFLFECLFPSQCCTRYGHCQNGECV